MAAANTAEITVSFPYDVSLTGTLARRQYGDGQTALVLDTDEGPETLSVNLAAYGLYPADADHVFIKDYSEHEGVADSLVEAGVAQITRMVTFGGFGTSAKEIKLTA